MAASSLDLYLAFGVVDSNVGFTRSHLFWSLSPIPPPLTPPPFSAAARKPI